MALGRGYFNGPRQENHPPFYTTYLNLIKRGKADTAEMLYGAEARNYEKSRNVMSGKMRRRKGKTQRKSKKAARKTRRA
jgi:hypothetical protein